MSARTEQRAAPADWEATHRRTPITREQLIGMASGQSPELLKRVAKSCREAARNRVNEGTYESIESVQRHLLGQAADLDAAAAILERLACR